MRKLILLFAIGLTQLTGCASQMMVTAKNQSLPVLNADKSRIVFMRSSSHGTVVSEGLYEVINDKPKFIAVLANNNKYFFDMKPGNHDFMSVGSSGARFLQGNFKAGKTYYVATTPRGWPGINFALHPFGKSNNSKFNINSGEFKDMLTDTVLVESSPEATKWGASFQNRVDKIFAVEWPLWKNKSDNFKAPYTIK